MDALLAAFEGPYSWIGDVDAPAVSSTAIATRPGVYLWTVPTAIGILVYYIGQTGRSFVVRMREHYNEHAAGFYHLYEPVSFARGEKSMMWPGLYDRHEKRTAEECMAAYRDIAPIAAELTRLYRFFFAEMDVQQRVRERVEAALAIHLGGLGGNVGTFQDEGIRYRPRRDSEQPIACAFESTVALVGLPKELLI